VTTILLLVLAADPAADTAASAMAASAADGLEGRAHVELERVSKLPSDDDAVQRATAAKATAVIEVSWPDADGRRAHLHAHLKPDAAWIDRDVLFEKTSKPWERGRAIGLAIAAMLPEEAAAAKEPVVEPAPEPEPVVPTPPPPPVAPSVNSGASPVVVSKTVDADRPLTRAATSFDLVLLGELATSFRDPVATTARLGATYWPSSWLGVRVLAGYRASSVTAASARVAHFDGGAGLAARLYGSTAGLRVVMYADVRVAREVVTRTRLDGVEEQRAHTLPYAALTGEAGYGFAPNFGLVLTLGAELALGRTTLTVRDSAVSSLPAISLTSGLGLRWSY
jgi:hypothetical protein